MRSLDRVRWALLIVSVALVWLYARGQLKYTTLFVRRLLGE